MEEMEEGLLELTISKEAIQGTADWPIVDAASLDENAWASLIHECIAHNLPCLTFLISKDILQQKSSFFESLLCSGFRESSETHANVTWDPAIFCSLLCFMCLGKLHLPKDMESLLQGILFFGVETAMVALVEKISSGKFLRLASKLWSLAKGMGVLPVAEACVESFAMYFEEGINQSNLQHLPFRFLAECIDHKELTVSSEKFLCEAVLNRFLCKKKPDGHDPCVLSSGDVHHVGFDDTENDYDGDIQCTDGPFFSSDAFLGLLQKVKVLILPLDFLLGSVSQCCPARMFDVEGSKLKSYNELFPLLEKVAGKTIQQLQTTKNHDITLRITKHSTKLDLAGCHQISAAILFESLLQFVKYSNINDLEFFLEAETEVQKVLAVRKSPLVSFNQDWCRKISLQSLVHVNMEGCWRINQDDLVTWLCVACPNLKFLDISHCPQLNANILSQISSPCKNLESVNLALYFKRLPVKSLDHAHVVSSSSFRQRESIPRCGFLPCLKSLSIEGRSSLRDHHLDLIAGCCSNLSDVNLGGCSQLSDRGLAQFLARLTSLTAIKAPYTAFGDFSVDALMCQAKNSPFSPLNVSESLHSFGPVQIPSLALTTLDLEGCSGLHSDAMKKLLRVSFCLKTLNLGYTEVGDSAMFCFYGTSLQEINLRETQVSDQEIARILKLNPSLKVINIRGCGRATVPMVFECVAALQDEHTFEDNISRGLTLENLAVGWGFSDSMLSRWKSSLYSLQSLSIGLGGRLSEVALSGLYKLCPHLKHLSLTLQVISDTSLLSLLKNLPTLERLELHQCFGEISSKFIAVAPINLSCLTLERGVSWITDTDVELLARTCKGLTSISFVGCMLLTSKSLQKMASTWQGMKNLSLQECGTMTSKGGYCLLACKGLRQLTLRHNGSGLKRNFAECAYLELPLLQDLCLDICDSSDKGFDSISGYKVRSLRMLRLIRCESSKNSLNEMRRRHYKDTVLIEWSDTQERTSLIHEGL